MLAENLTDSEFKDFYKFYESNFLQKDEYTLYKDTIESLTTNKTVYLNVNLIDYIGIWAYKLRNLGFLYEDILEDQFIYHEDSERYIDEDGTARTITQKIIITESAKLLYNILNIFVNYEK
jgi:hypothetical protein